MWEINEEYYIKVSDFMLQKPAKKNLIDGERCESLKELRIILVTTEV